MYFFAYLLRSTGIVKIAGCLQVNTHGLLRLLVTVLRTFFLTATARDAYFVYIFFLVEKYVKRL